MTISPCVFAFCGFVVKSPPFLLKFDGKDETCAMYKVTQDQWSLGLRSRSSGWYFIKGEGTLYRSMSRNHV